MIRVSVIYSTLSGHTKKLADEIGRTLGVEPQNLKYDSNYYDCDIAFIGGGIYSGQLSPDLEGYIERLDKEKIPKAAVFMSSVSGDYSKSDLSGKLKARGIEVVGEFSCKGNFIVMALGHPNKKDLSDITAFATKIAEKEIEKSKQK